jgi:chromosome partitioning protein
MKSLVLLNNMGGVGKTTLVFNIGHMAARLGKVTLLLDYDPQCNLTAVILDEADLLDLWESPVQDGRTVAGCVELVWRGEGDLRDPELRQVADNLWLLPGDPVLSGLEQVLAEGWGQINITTALARLTERAAAKVSADLVILDVGPSLGALNRAALLGCDAVVVPLTPDLFSLQGLKILGPTLHQWNDDWAKVEPNEPRPRHAAKPLGYIVQQHLARVDRAVEGYLRWAVQIPSVFHQYVIGDPTELDVVIDDDPCCIANLKHFASLMPLAQAARRPLFDLKQAHGIAGGQIQTVAKARVEFEALTQDLMKRLE